MTLNAQIEAILFVAGEPITLDEMARAMQVELEPAMNALLDVQVALDDRGSGLQVVHIAGGYQLATRPDVAEVIGRLLARTASKLSRAALETLAIIAYRQPVTQPEIEAVRGVQVNGVVKTLLERKLIAEAGRKAAIGRPILYATTQEFLHYFALQDLSELPILEEAGDPSQALVSPKPELVGVVSEDSSAEADASHGEELIESAVTDEVH